MSYLLTTKALSMAHVDDRPQLSTTRLSTREMSCPARHTMLFGFILRPLTDRTTHAPRPTMWLCSFLFTLWVMNMTCWMLYYIRLYFVSYALYMIKSCHVWFLGVLGHILRQCLSSTASAHLGTFPVPQRLGCWVGLGVNPVPNHSQSHYFIVNAGNWNHHFSLSSMCVLAATVHGGGRVTSDKSVVGSRARLCRHTDRQTDTWHYISLHKEVTR